MVLDCKELVAGSTLYLPIAVAGGLFSVGDGHARQGDGEVAVTAIECPMERVDLTFHLLPNLQITTPRANTPAGWLTPRAARRSATSHADRVEAMVEWMMQRFALTRHNALGLASVLVDLRITQIVNEVSGVHALLSHEAIREAGLKSNSVDLWRCDLVSMSAMPARTLLGKKDEAASSF